MHVEMAIKVKTDKLYSVFCKHFEKFTKTCKEKIKINI